MGKTKHNRRKNKPEPPTGLPSVKDIEKEEEEFGDQQAANTSKSDATIYTIIEQLQGNVEDKVFALHSLASIFDTPTCVKEVVRHKVVRVAAPLLLDPSSAVRNAAAGALRNLTSSGNHEICDLLVEQDIMTPLAALLHKYTTDWQLVGKASDSEEIDTFAQAIYLLWNLCEGNSRAVQYFNDGDLLSVLIKYLGANLEFLSVSLAIMQCLITVVEDNPSACKALQEAEPALHSLIILEGESSEILLIRVLTAGVLLKMGSWFQTSKTSVVLTAIVEPLKQDQRQVFHKLSSIEPGKLSEDQAALQEASRLLEAQQIALELLTNLCASDDDEAMDMDSSTSSSEGGMCDLEFGDSESAPSMSLDPVPFSLLPEVHEMVVSQNILKRIWEKTILPAENALELLNEHSGGQHLVKRLDVLRSRAFLCLNNLIPALDLQDMGGPGGLYEIWTNIGTLLFKTKDPKVDQAVVEAASAAMRAALQKYAQCGSCQDCKELQLSDIEFLTNSGSYADPSIRANLVKIAGLLGMIAIAQSSEMSYKVLKGIGQYLLDISNHEAELWVQAEALDTIMDVFGEDSTDNAAAELNLTEKLQATLPIFRKKVHVNKKMLREHYPLITTVNTNITRFIQYKSKRISVSKTQ